MVLTAGPGVVSTGQDRWAAPLPPPPPMSPVCFLLSWSEEPPSPTPPCGLQELCLLPVQGEEGSCRPGQKANFIIFSAVGIGDKGCIPPLVQRGFHPQPFFLGSWWHLKVFTRSQEEQGLQAVKALLGHLLLFSFFGGRG